MAGMERNVACRNNYVDTARYGRCEIYYPVELNGCRGLLRGSCLPHKLFFITRVNKHRAEVLGFMAILQV